jgi:hypothetical protein
MTITQHEPTVAPVPFSKLTIWGFVLAFFYPIVGIFLSHAGLSSINRGQRRGKVLAVWAIVLNYVFIVLTPFVAALMIWFAWILLITMMGAPPEARTGPIEFWIDIFDAWAAQNARN